jgi:hypothetical protein
MFSTVSRLRQVFVASIVCAAMSHHVVACGVCVLLHDQFRLSHPHALRIAIATRSAMERGAISTVDDGPAEFEANLVRLTSQLTYPQSIKESVTVDVLVVDDSAIHRVELQGLRSRVSRVIVGQHNPAPVPCRSFCKSA